MTVLFPPEQNSGGTVTRNYGAEGIPALAGLDHGRAAVLPECLATPPQLDVLCFFQKL
jgi:hypothetical protein